MPHGLFENKKGEYEIAEVQVVDGKYDPKSFPPNMTYIAFGTPDQLQKIQARREGKEIEGPKLKMSEVAGEAAAGITRGRATKEKNR